MNLVLVDTVSYVEEKLNAFHRAMFHGKARREGLAHWEAADHEPNDELADPMWYTCNGFETPAVAMPSVNLVVSKTARPSFEGLPGVVFARVGLEKVIFLPYAVGDFSYFERADFRRDPRRFGHDTIFERWPDRPELHVVVGERFEVVCSSAHRLAENYPDAAAIVLQHPCGSQAPAEVPLSAEMVAKHAVLGTVQGILFDRYAFDQVQHLIDHDYYGIVEVQV